MPTNPSPDSNVDIDAKASKLKARCAEIEKAKLAVEAELNSRKRALKNLMDECRKEGYDPNTLEEDIRHNRQVLMVKMELLEKDVETAEKTLAPMMTEIQKP